MGTVGIYVASTVSEKSGRGGWSCVVQYGHQTKEFSGSSHTRSSNRLALQAMLQALHHLTHITEGAQLHVETNNAELAEGMAGALAKWKANDWKVDGRRLPHEGLWKRIHKFSRRFTADAELNVAPAFRSLLSRACYLATDRDHDDRHLSAYIDGAYYPEIGTGGWGAVVDDGRRVHESSGGMPASDNNAVELIAAIRALEMLPSDKPILIYTDSVYVTHNVMQLPLIKENAWKLPDSGKLVSNRELWVLLDRLIASHQVRFEWVKGHSGVRHNETADRLARRAAKREAERSHSFAM